MLQLTRYTIFDVFDTKKKERNIVWIKCCWNESAKKYLHAHTTCVKSPWYGPAWLSDPATDFGFVFYVIDWTAEQRLVISKTKER